MGRIFTFGCSFTDYVWPTWADILLYGNDGKNFGISGSGNESMLYRVMEADRVFNFTKEDQIIVMFTTPIRWDLITNEPPEFLGYGQVINVDKLLKHKDKLYTIEGLCFKSYYSILAIKTYLENKQIKYLFGSVNDIFDDVDNYGKIIEISDDLKKLMCYIDNEVKFELSSVYSFLLKNGYLKEKNWGITKNWKNHDDYHPRPHYFYKYVTKIIQPKLGINLKMTIEDIILFENEIEMNNDKDIFLNTFNQKYPIINNKKCGPQIYIKK